LKEKSDKLKGQSSLIKIKIIYKEEKKMGEKIPMIGIHKKCGKRKLFRSVGGDVMIWCDYCNEPILDYYREVAIPIGRFSWLPIFWYWLKRSFKK